MKNNHATTCRACANDYENRRGQALAVIAICKRLRAKVRPWWEKEPGYFWREFRPSKPTPLRKPSQPWHLPTANPKEIVAELGRQSKRLAGQPDITFAEAA